MKNEFKADFITTDYENYYDPDKNPWGEKRDRLYQHTDLPECKGLPMFVKDFETESTDNTYIYFTALGCAAIYINGKKLAVGELTPGWSDYNKRALYRKFDVSAYLNKGKNRILAVVSAGWYTGRIAGGYYGKGTPCFACEITNYDFSLKTDSTWLAAVGGQIRTADIWDGEFRNGEFAGYEEISVPSYDVSNWQSAKEYAYKGEVTEFIGPIVKVREALSLKPQSIKISNGVKDNGTDYGELTFSGLGLSLPVKLNKGESLIADFGQESVGFINAKFKGSKGCTLKFRYAEFLNDSGSIDRGNDGPKGSAYTINLRSALGKAYYKCANDDVCDYKPTFTFFGYRYVEITASEDVEILDLIAEVVGNDTVETGKLETSDTLVNKLISNTLWGQRSNYLYVPTDCPQRDERLGWTGDAQAFSITASYNADVYGFFRKWMQDMRDSQSESGGYGDVNPRVGCCNSEDACAWADAGIIIPYNMYIMYGDKKILEEHFDSMDAYMKGLVAKYDYTGPVPRYGDWLAYDWCDNKFISSAYFVHDCDLMIEISHILEKPENKKYFENLKEKAYAYFEENFLKDGKPKGTTQCEKIICLAFDLLSDEKAKETAKELSLQIKENDDKLSCGFLGTYNLCPALSKFGEDKTAYNLLLQRNEPSWLYSIDQGATTIWERWNSYTLAGGFGDVGMNSFNHYAYGSVVEWIYKYAAGIISLKPGFKTIKLAPCFDLRTPAELPKGQNNITFIRASFNSRAGEITSNWEIKNGIKYYCKVPANTEVYLPAQFKNITLNGEKITPEIKENKYFIPLMPGEYNFELK